jgi:hypothetical protein
MAQRRPAAGRAAALMARADKSMERQSRTGGAVRLPSPDSEEQVKIDFASSSSRNAMQTGQEWPMLLMSAQIGI